MKTNQEMIKDALGFVRRSWALVIAAALFVAVVFKQTAVQTYMKIEAVAAVEKCNSGRQTAFDYMICQHAHEVNETNTIILIIRGIFEECWMALSFIWRVPLFIIENPLLSIFASIGIAFVIWITFKLAQLYRIVNTKSNEDQSWNFSSRNKQPQHPQWSPPREDENTTSQNNNYFQRNVQMSSPHSSFSPFTTSDSIPFDSHH